MDESYEKSSNQLLITFLFCHVYSQDDLPEDIYPVCPIEDRVSPTCVIRGSCSTYNTRKNSTEEVKKLGLKEAEEKYGEKLVLVAIQEARSAALGGDRCDIIDSLVITSYVYLERIGRSRDLGEVTQGKHGKTRAHLYVNIYIYEH